jgi:hypothetical protein
MEIDRKFSSTSVRASGRALIAAALAAGTIAASAGVATAALGHGRESIDARQPLAAGQVGSRSAVPWSKIGPGWSLAEYSASSGGDGQPHKAGAATLYLVDPAGGKYSLVTWAAKSPEAGWRLQAWSGDTKRALFVSGLGRQHVHQVQLATGRVMPAFTLPANVAVLDYTRPRGLNIVALRQPLTGKPSILRYDLHGALQATLATGDSAAYSADGTILAVGGQHGLELVSNAGGVIRKLPVPGGNCSAVRWWSASTVLASCTAPNSAAPRVWLVPAGGAAPKPLTPQRTGHSRDLGDINAYQLSSGLYLEALGACGTLEIAKQPAHAPVRIINVPGSSSNLIVTATRSRLLVERLNPCMPGSSLVWFNPATRSMTVAIAAHHVWGVIGAVPYFEAGKL